MISRKISKDIVSYSKIEAERVASIIINTAINKEVTDKNKINKLLKAKINNKRVDLEDYNVVEINKLLNEINNRIQKQIIEIEDGKTENLELSKTIKGTNYKYKRKGIVCEIPTGNISGGVLLANTGPIIPVKLSFVGMVNSNMYTKVKSYGINNAYIESYIKVSLVERATLPGMTKSIKIRRKIPLFIRIIQGEIPDYYAGEYQISKSTKNIDNTK